jgi:hypothetical protein
MCDVGMGKTVANESASQFVQSPLDRGLTYDRKWICVI